VPLAAAAGTRRYSRAVNLDVIARCLLGLGLLVVAGAWARTIVTQPKARSMTAAQHRLFDRGMLVAVGLLVTATIIGLITNSCSETGGIALAVTALTGWAHERQQRGVRSEDPTLGSGR
jgi:Na+/phosphate symporter